MEAARPAVGSNGFGGGAVSHEVPSTPRRAHLCAVPGPAASSRLSGLGAALLQREPTQGLGHSEPHDRRGGWLSAAEKSAERSRASALRF